MHESFLCYFPVVYIIILPNILKVVEKCHESIRKTILKMFATICNALPAPTFHAAITLTGTKMENEDNGVNIAPVDVRTLTVEVK